MKCPKCKTAPLRPTRFDGGLPAYGCSSCNGALISLMYYRDWVERSCGKIDEQVEAAAAAEPADTSVAISCPKCGRLMSKYRIGNSANNSLDLCASCDETWLDNGEWELLQSLQLDGELARIFTDEWQRRVRKELSETARRERLRKLVGDEDLARAEQMRAWLKSNPYRAEILFFVNHD